MMTGARYTAITRIAIRQAHFCLPVRNSADFLSAIHDKMKAATGMRNDRQTVYTFHQCAPSTTTKNTRENTPKPSATRAQVKAVRSRFWCFWQSCSCCKPASLSSSDADMPPGSGGTSASGGSVRHKFILSGGHDTQSQKRSFLERWHSII